MADNHNQVVLRETATDKGSNLSQGSHPLEVALLQCLFNKVRWGKAEHRPCPLFSIWHNSERPALLRSSLWHLLRTLLQGHHLLPMSNPSPPPPPAPPGAVPKHILQNTSYIQIFMSESVSGAPGIRP